MYVSSMANRNTTEASSFNVFLHVTLKFALEPQLMMSEHGTVVLTVDKEHVSVGVILYSFARTIISKSVYQKRCALLASLLILKHEYINSFN